MMKALVLMIVKIISQELTQMTAFKILLKVILSNISIEKTKNMKLFKRRIMTNLAAHSNSITNRLNKKT